MIQQMLAIFFKTSHLLLGINSPLGYKGFSGAGKGQEYSVPSSVVLA